MYALHRVLCPLRVSSQNALRRCSMEAPSAPKRKRRILTTIGKSTGLMVVAVPTVGGVYYAVSDDITKRQMRVTIQGVGRFFRYDDCFITEFCFCSYLLYSVLPYQ